MTSFVLVHGAWHGSWCWKRVRSLLQAQGHDVFTPTLTGVGERSHLLSHDVNLETHILDIVNLIRWEELSDVVLCGHSYAGCVITGVADRLPDRIRALIYLDAFVLKNGESLQQQLPEQQRNQLLENARSADGWKVPPIPAEVFKVNATDRDWVNRQCTVQPIGTFQQNIALTGGVDKIKNITYVLAGGFVEGSPFPRFFEQAKVNGWNTRVIGCGHDVMLDEPEELASVLIDAAQSPQAARIG